MGEQCSCICMDCIEGRHCGETNEHPDGTLMVCNIVPESDYCGDPDAYPDYPHYEVNYGA